MKINDIRNIHKLTRDKYKQQTNTEEEILIALECMLKMLQPITNYDRDSFDARKKYLESTIKRIGETIKNLKMKDKKEEWFKNQSSPTKIIDELSQLCKVLIDEYYFNEAITILKAIITIDERD